MTEDEEVESAARALYYRDKAEVGTVNPIPWSLLDERAKNIYRKAVQGRQHDG